MNFQTQQSHTGGEERDRALRPAFSTDLTTPLRPRRTLRAITFICRTPQAKSVSLVGDFNNWNPVAHPMRQMPDRAWLARVELKHGHHRYAFLVDGQIVEDSTAQGFARNDQGQRVSLVPVS